MDDISILVGMAVGVGLTLLVGILIYLGLSIATKYNRRNRSSK